MRTRFLTSRCITDAVTITALLGGTSLETCIRATGVCYTTMTYMSHWTEAQVQTGTHALCLQPPMLGPCMSA